MTDLTQTLLGNGPYPFDVGQIENFTRFYESDAINIVITKANVAFTKGEQVHSHDSYEFLIPLSPMPHIGCDGKRTPVPVNMVLPINAMQAHGPLSNMQNCLFAAIHIESAFLRRIAAGNGETHETVFVNKPVTLSKELKLLIKKFAEESEKSKIGTKLIIDALSTQITVQLLRDCALSDDNLQPGAAESGRANLDAIVDAFSKNYASITYSTQTTAREANLSKFYFIKAFKNHTGKTPYNYLLELRINKAKELLKNSTFSVTEIYFLCGFVNHSHFTSAFKKKVGMSPSMYRKVYCLG